MHKFTLEFRIGTSWEVLEREVTNFETAMAHFHLLLAAGKEVRLTCENKEEG